MARINRQVAAEDVLLILTMYEHGLREAAIALAFETPVFAIQRVLSGWLPQPRSVIVDLEGRRTQAQDRKTKAPPAVRKPAWQRKAHDAVHRAVADGTLRRGPCHCGNRRVQAHHHLGYAEEHRLDVLWLCARHHKDAHKNHALDEATA